MNGTQKALLQTISFKKEISVGWLITFLAGGIMNLVLLIWTASAVVENVKQNKVSIGELELTVQGVQGQVNEHSIELGRQEERIKNLEEE